MTSKALVLVVESLAVIEQQRAAFASMFGSFRRSFCAHRNNVLFPAFGASLENTGHATILSFVCNAPSKPESGAPLKAHG